MEWEGPADTAATLESAPLEELSKNERIKLASRGLLLVDEGKGEPHSFRDELDGLARGERVTLSNTAKELSKFFGIYRQQERGERGRKTGDQIFMVRIKCPAGGELSPQQWLALDAAAESFADGTIRITSRQGVQYHHVYGAELAALVRHLNRGYREQGTLGACGDVNRNVMCSPIDGLDPRHDPRGRELAYAIAEELAPRSSAYFQVFLSDAQGRQLVPINDDEPIYGSQYLPRKFKIGIAHPSDNSVDVLTNDVAFVPVARSGADEGELWDLWSGGGLGLTHNNPRTAPLLALYLGRIRRGQVVAAARAIAILQKENGERKDRRLARWKYTIRRLGLDAVRQELKTRFAIELSDAEPEALAPMRLHLGWNRQRDGRHWYGISVENGRMHPPLRKAVSRAVAELGLGVRLTPQQDLLLCNVADRAALEAILRAEGVAPPESISLARRNAMACPALPTCGLAMTHAEGILPSYLVALEAAGLGDLDVVVRMTGCPNNCARPSTAEVGIYGYGKNDHVILVGGSREGTRLARTLYARLPEEKMVPALVGLFRAIREHNTAGLPAGDFLHRADPAQLRAWIGIEEEGAA
jgi:sulfite reductase (ferredoxin)